MSLAKRNEPLRHDKLLKYVSKKLKISWSTGLLLEIFNKFLTNSRLIVNICVLGSISRQSKGEIFSSWLITDTKQWSPPRTIGKISAMISEYEKDVQNSQNIVSGRKCIVGEIKYNKII